LERRFGLVMDEGNLDAIGLHLDGPVKSRTKDELVQKGENFNQ